MIGTQILQIGEVTHSGPHEFLISLELRQQIQMQPQQYWDSHKILLFEKPHRSRTPNSCETLRARRVVLYLELVATTFWQFSRHATQFPSLAGCYFPSSCRET